MVKVLVVHQIGVLHVLEVHLCQAALDHPPSKIVYVALQQWNRLDQKIVTCSQKIKIEDLIADHAEDSCVIVDGMAWGEADDNSIESPALDITSNFVETKNVIGIGEDLVGC